MRFGIITALITLIAMEAHAQSESAATNDSSKFVQVAEVKLRSKPQHWAPGATTLKYGESLNVVIEERGWAQVRTASGADGFVPLSALTKSAVVLNTGDAPTRIEADTAEVVLAGKGFSNNLEDALASRDASMNFRAVDEMEVNPVDDSELLSFIEDGKLSVGEAG